MATTDKCFCENCGALIQNVLGGQAKCRECGQITRVQLNCFECPGGHVVYFLPKDKRCPVAGCGKPLTRTRR